MEIEKKHILKSFKNEKEVIEEVNRIKEEKVNRPTSSISGYNVEKPQEEELQAKTIRAAKLDMQEAKDYRDEPLETENPDQLTNESNDLERPLPERIINNRIR